MAAQAWPDRPDHFLAAATTASISSADTVFRKLSENPLNWVTKENSQWQVSACQHIPGNMCPYQWLFPGNLCYKVGGDDRPQAAASKGGLRCYGGAAGGWSFLSMFMKTILIWLRQILLRGLEQIRNKQKQNCLFTVYYGVQYSTLYGSWEHCTTPGALYYIKVHCTQLGIIALVVHAHHTTRSTLRWV